MILNYIKLVNIRSYVEEEIKFPRGITLFQGDIGSGKSTILMAIEFALFGSGSRLDSLLKTKADFGTIKLGFEVNGVEYTVFRKLERSGQSVKQSAGYIETNNVQEDYSATELKARILQILEFNEPSGARAESRIYRYAVFTPQEEMKLVLEGKKDRLETVRRAFGIEDYKVAADNAAMIAKGITSKMGTLKARFEDLDDKKLELDEIKEEKSSLQKSLAQYEIDLEKIQDKEKIAKKKDADISKDKEKKAKIESDISLIENNIQNKQESLEDIQSNIDSKNEEILQAKKELDDAKKKKAPTKKSVEELEQEIKDAREGSKKLVQIEADIRNGSDFIQQETAKLDNSETDISEIRENVEQVEKDISKSKKEQADLEGVLEDKKERRIKIETDIENLQKNMQELSEAGAACPVCEKPLEADHIKHLGEERKERLKKLETELQDTSDTIQNATKDLEGVEKNINILENKKSNLEEQFDILERLEPKRTELQELEQEKIEIDKKLEYAIEKNVPDEQGNKVDYLIFLKEELSQYHRVQEDIARISTDLETHQKNILELEKKKKENSVDITKLEKSLITQKKNLEAFSGLQQKITAIQKELDEISDKLTSTKVQIASTKTEMSGLDENIKRLTSEIKVGQKHQKEFDKLSDYADWIKEFFIPTLDVIEKQIMVSIQQRFNDTYTNWFRLMIDEPGKVSRIDEEFAPIVEQDGVTLPLDYFSGGEKTSVALAYRLTLNTLMRQETASLKSNLLILDEPTDGFSKSQINKIRNVLYELHSEQIILVSHERELESHVDHVFSVSKESGESKVTQTS